VQTGYTTVLLEPQASATCYSFAIAPAIILSAPTDQHVAATRIGAFIAAHSFVHFV